ncbi:MULTISPECIES: DUF2244 domain-containing protein [unclassified Roseateles]|uniref:DUF2244 domain-containing protein n=1 Tax=unclassified Roseateles TaxID=2626991 RepID=UPI0006F64947|nr:MULTISPECIES: DUF2244 domain-containing protein [unclassified Roseateles]KQW43647.1 hypothetical protein ASC81_18000 [Pelomonas sp. Root405]KRA71385.1 hypothetical protein ASD88_16520 [Pelomonas sp. Root662]
MTPTTTSWQLRRNCSLTPCQALLAASVPALALLGVSLAAAAQGMWWVVLFALLNIVVLAAALCSYARHALDGETLRLGEDGMLHIEQQCGTRLQRISWPVSMVRIQARDGEPITLWAGPHSLQIGREARPAMRQQTALQLRRALRLDAGYF